MGFLYFVKRHPEIDDSVPMAKWERQKLCFVRPKSDAALFEGCSAGFFAEVYSQQKVGDGMGDLRRMLARVAFYIRLMNVALNRNDYCVPIFYVSKDWKGQCMLMFQHTDKKKVR